MIQQQNYIKQLEKQMEHQQHNMKSMEFNSRKNTNEILEFQNKQISIETPDNVKNILDRIHNLSGTNQDRTNFVNNIGISSINNNIDTQDEASSNNDRLVSDTTLSDNNLKKKQQKKNKKSNILIS